MEEVCKKLQDWPITAELRKVKKLGRVGLSQNNQLRIVFVTVTRHVC